MKIAAREQESEYDRRWLRTLETMLETACDRLAADRPPWLLILLSVTVGTAYCVWLFDRGFLLGTSSYWENPRGLVGYSLADIPTALSGYLFFQQDVWGVPLFQVKGLGAPSGVNVIFTDSIPWVSLAGRLAFLATGAPLNLYGAWTAMCVVASGATLTGLVAAMGQRNLAAAGMAAVAGLTMPALLARWGHMSLTGLIAIGLRARRSPHTRTVSSPVSSPRATEATFGFHNERRSKFL